MDTLTGYVYRVSWYRIRIFLHILEVIFSVVNFYKRWIDFKSTRVSSLELDHIGDIFVLFWYINVWKIFKNDFFLTFRI